MLVKFVPLGCSTNAWTPTGQCTSDPSPRNLALHPGLQSTPPSPAWPLLHPLVCDDVVGHGVVPAT